MNVGTVRRDGRSDPFFDAAAAGWLALRRCLPCRRWYAPDAGSCLECGTEELAWTRASGTATLVSWAIVPGRGSSRETARLALVELAEGPWLYGRLADVPPDALRAGLPLTARFEHPAEGESYPIFVVPDNAPAAGGASQ